MTSFHGLSTITSILCSQGIEEYKWDIEKDTEYWDFSTNILGNFTFDVRTMRKDLEIPLSGYPCNPNVQKMSGTP